MKTLPPEFRREPKLALDGGKDGLDVIRRLIAQARDRLTADGLLLIEVGGLRNAMKTAFGGLKLRWLRTHDGSNCVCLARMRHTALRSRATVCPMHNSADPGVQGIRA
jgi:ribosomal protein L3 glutamine methyltransferase